MITPTLVVDLSIILQVFVFIACISCVFVATLWSLVVIPKFFLFDSKSLEQGNPDYYVDIVKPAIHEKEPLVLPYILSDPIATFLGANNQERDLKLQKY